MYLSLLWYSFLMNEYLKLTINRWDPHIQIHRYSRQITTTNRTLLFYPLARDILPKKMFQSIESCRS